METEILIIGAGLAGLAAGHQLVKAGKDVTILEKNSRVGGRVFTESVDPYHIDAGAQFLANFYTHTLALIRELNLQTELRPIPGKSAILRSGRLYPLWPDIRLAFTSLISLSDKLLLLRPALQALQHWQELDLHVFHRAYRLDESSLTEYSRRVLNERVLERVLQPPLSGLFYWTPEHTSQAMLFLLLKAALNMRLFTLDHGLGTLAEAMASHLNVIRNAEVSQVEQISDGRYQAIARIQGEIQPVLARGIVCALPANLVPGIFQNITPEQRDFFEAINYSATTVAALGINHRLPSSFYGLFFPRCETPSLATAAIQSAKNPAMLPKGKDLLVLYASGPAGQTLIHEEDQVILNRLLDDFSRVGLEYKLGEEESLLRVYRWPQALPLFDTGHFQRLHHFFQKGIETGQVVFAGDYLSGPFMEGAITSGFDAAKRLMKASKT